VELRKNNQTMISYDFVRAAHTLAGVSRSTGFTDISDLASALESWLQERMDATTAPDILQLNLLEQTINALGEMVATLRRKQEPKPRPDLITRLQIKKKQLNNLPPEGRQQNELSADKINLNVEIEQKAELPSDEIMAAEENHYAQHMEQEQASDSLQDQTRQPKDDEPSAR